MEGNKQTPYTLSNRKYLNSNFESISSFYNLGPAGYVFDKWSHLWNTSIFYYAIYDSPAVVFFSCK